MLQIIGKCVGTKDEIVEPANGPAFKKTLIGIETGEGLDRKVNLVQASKDFPASDLPKDGENVALVVFVSAYPTRGGANFRLTATERVKAGLRAAAV